MNINNAKYELTAVRPDQYPVSQLPEIAFVGRSNVGKSSIINALLNRRNLARKSGTPGKTREINFYNIEELYFVDLPGYGYASVSKTKKASWGDFVEEYLKTREQLKFIIMLVDIRHTPSEEDKMMYQWILHQNIKHAVVATKLDKIPRAQIAIRLADITKTLNLSNEVKLFPFSSESKQGKDEVWKEIEVIVSKV